MRRGSLRLLALGLALVLLFAACSKSDPVSKIELDPATLTLKVGDEATVDATVYLASGKVSAAVPVWATSDEDVVSVEDGVVVALAVGDATVTATVGSVSGSVTVSVSAADEPEEPDTEDPDPEEPGDDDPEEPGEDEPEEPEETVVVEFNEAGPLTLVRTQEFELSASVSGTDEGADGVNWAVTDDTIVTLLPSLDGDSVTIQAVGVGTTEVPATSKADTSAKATLEVTVESLEVSVELDLGDAVTTGTEGSVTASIAGLFDGADEDVTWSVNPAGAVDFDEDASADGDEVKFTVQQTGDITITATSAQDSAVSESVSFTAMDTDLDNMNVYVGDWVETPEDGWALGTQFNPFDSFNDALAAVAEGGTIHLADGTVEVTSHASAGKPFSLIGQSQEGSVLDFSNDGDPLVRFEIQTGDVHIQDLTIIGNNPASGSAYQGLKFQPGTGGSALENITLTNVTVEGSRNSAIDLHSVDGAVLTNVTARDVTNGVGIAISASSNIELNGVHTENNAWGGLALFGDASEPYGLKDVKNVTVSADSTFDEQVGVYSEMDPGTELIDVALEGFTHAVRNAEHKGAGGGGERFTYYFKSENDARNYAGYVSHPGASTIQLVSGDDVSELGAFQVLSGMSIAVAVDAAHDGDTVEILAGNHSIASTVLVDESITLRGLAGNQVFTNQPTGVTIEVTGADVTIEGLNFITLNPDADQLAFLYVHGNQPNVMIDGNTFTGTYTANSPAVVRGMRITITPGAAGMQIINNLFTNIRQPAYIDGPGSPDPDVELLVADNHAVGTRGWVIDSVAMGINFQGNSFENHAALEMISFIGSSNDGYRELIEAVSVANNDAVVKYQWTNPEPAGEEFIYPPQ